MNYQPTIYLYKYIVSWNRFHKTLLPEIADFYSNLNMEDITKHAKRVWKRFGKKILVIIMIYMFKAIHCYLQMYLKPFEINALKYMNLIQLFFISTWISMAILLKKDRNRSKMMKRRMMMMH